MANLFDKLRRLLEKKGGNGYKNRDIKRITDALFLAAQEQTLWTNSSKPKSTKRSRTENTEWALGLKKKLAESKRART